MGMKLYIGLEYGFYLPCILIQILYYNSRDLLIATAPAYALISCVTVYVCVGPQASGRAEGDSPRAGETFLWCYAVGRWSQRGEGLSSPRPHFQIGTARSHVHCCIQSDAVVQVTSIEPVCVNYSAFKIVACYRDCRYKESAVLFMEIISVLENGSKVWEIRKRYMSLD